MLSDPITRRALAEVLILALALGPLGVWVLLHRQAYAAESLSHGLLPGLVLAALAGIPLVLGAAGGALVAAGGDRARRPRRAHRRRRRRRGRGLDAVRPRRAARARARTRRRGSRSCCSATCWGSRAPTSPPPRRSRSPSRSRWPPSTARSRSPPSTAPAARSLGAPPARWEAALLALLGVGTVAAAPGLGSLLLVALVIAPAAAALRVTRRLPAALALAAGVAVAAGVGGLALSYYADLAAGASVALCAAAAPIFVELAT